jgi:hypothetical protein
MLRVAIMLLLFSASALAQNAINNANLALAINQVAPGAQWMLNGDACTDADADPGLRWMSPAIPRPTCAALSAAIAALPPILPTLNFTQFMGLFTQAEQLAIAGSSDPQVKLFVIMATGEGGSGIQLNNAQVIAGIDYLTTTLPPILTDDEAARILAGTAPP